MKRIVSALAVGIMMLALHGNVQGQTDVVVFNSFATNNFVNSNTGIGTIGVEDYSFANPISNHPAMRFVGGVSDAGNVLDFIYRDTGGAQTGSFSVALPQAGNFIWTITLGAFGAIPTAGSLEMFFDTSRPENQLLGGTNMGTWFISGADDIGAGTSPLNPSGLAAGENFAFELTGTVPEPTSGLILLAGALGFVARRRR